MSDGNLSDVCLVEKFRRENTEQFLILARMHLSFLLDLNTDDPECFTDKQKRKWNLVSFGKKVKSKGVMEGVPLTQEGICQVYQLIEYLKKEQNIQVEGIFRRTGSLERQQELRSLLCQGLTLDLDSSQYSVHDCASVLKGFLADLPDPLLTEAYFPACCQIADQCITMTTGEQATQETKLMEALQLICLLLPTENQALLKDILDLLQLTASQETSNKMSPDNLAKIFTPHLLCPRKLPPNDLLTISQKYFVLVSFMIKKSSELFKIPHKLKVDFHARYERKKKILACSDMLLNESVTDAANTVFTFVDQERTAKENESNPTETALAQLYAHIQTLPESSKKRKLINKFNKENGHGTPLQMIRSTMAKKSFGDSIKKHIFQKGLAKSVKKAAALAHPHPLRSSSSDQLLNNTPPQQTIITRARLFCGNCDSSSDISNEDRERSAKKIKPSCSNSNEENDVVVDKTPSPCSKIKRIAYSHSESDINDLSDNNSYSNKYLTSTPAPAPAANAACLPLRARRDNLIFTPEEQDRKSMSPITRSTQRMTRAMQETMMTPRSRKPVLLLSGTNINALPNMEKHECQMDNVSEEITLEDDDDDEEEEEAATNSFKKMKNNKQTPPDALSATFKEYLSSRDILTSSPADESFSSRTDDFNSTDFKDLSDNKLTDSLLYCLDGNQPGEGDDYDDNQYKGEKELVLKPKQYDRNGKPIVFETSF